jgi:LuxR family maltose regulon positive regulatory protein
MANAPLLRDRPAIVVQAPAGFGKTSLLAQWRREHLAHGAVVGWLSVQEDDEPQRLVQGLVLALRTGAGRPTFGHTLLDPQAPAGLEAITIWLAEVAQAALNTVLIVDEADRLPAASRDSLGYLLRNAPPNLRVVVAARLDCNLGVEDLVDYGQCFIVGASMLRFQLDETMQLVHSRLGTEVDNDTIARLQDLTEGWPLGLQLALSHIAVRNDPGAAIAAMKAQGGELSERFLRLMLANLAADDVDFLTRIAILDQLHPSLCKAVTGLEDAAERLTRLQRDTPIFVAAEDGDSTRMHLLVRDALRERFAALQAEEQASLHMRAAIWLDGRGQLEAAAGHALSAGQRERAYDLAERSLYEALATHGRQGAVLEWLARLPDAELDRRPRLLLAAAWSLALSERHQEAGGLVGRLLARPSAGAPLRFECALISGAAAIFADDPDRFAELHDPWARQAPVHDPLLLHSHANRSALRALVDGEPALARLHVLHAPQGDFGPSLAYVRRVGELFVALSYVSEGQVLLAESLLPPILAAAEGDWGRRNPVACMLASLLATASWERDRPAVAAALLANRLDVLERGGLPDTLILGYCTLARIAMAGDAEPRAAELLAELHALGKARGMPRLCIASLADQVRMHARRFRSQTCRELCHRIDAQYTKASRSHGRLWRRGTEVVCDLARGHAAIAAQDWRAALEPLGRAEAAARSMNLGRTRIEIMGLRAMALDRRGEDARTLLLEAADLARACGLLRVFDDAHPALGDWAREVARADGAALTSGSPRCRVPRRTVWSPRCCARRPAWR